MIYRNCSVILTLSIGVWAFSVPGGCGTEAGNPKKPGPPSEVVQDAEVSNEVISSQLHDVTDATAEDQSNGLALNSVVSFENNVLGAMKRSCISDGDSAIVTGTRNIETVIPRIYRRVTVTQAVSGKIENVHTWSQAGGVISCRNVNAGAKVDLIRDNDLRLAIKVKKSISRARVTTVRRTSEVAKNSIESEVKGERSIEFGKPKVKGGAVELQYVIVDSDVTRSLKLSKKTSEIVKISSRSIISGDDPLDVVLEFKDGVWSKRTILSGTVESTQAGDSKIISSYKNVVFTAASGCLPEQGVVTGKIFAIGETEPAISYEINFELSGATISYSDGSTSEYVPDDCDLAP